VRDSLHGLATAKDDRPMLQLLHATQGAVWATDGRVVVQAQTPELRLSTEFPLIPGVALAGVSASGRAELVDSMTRLMVRLDGEEVRVIGRRQGWFPDTAAMQAQWPVGPRVLELEPKTLTKAALEASRAAKRWVKDNAGDHPVVELTPTAQGLRVAAGGFAMLVPAVDGGTPGASLRCDPDAWYGAVSAHGRNAKRGTGGVFLAVGDVPGLPVVLWTEGLVEAVYPLQVVDAGGGVQGG